MQKFRGRHIDNEDMKKYISIQKFKGENMKQKICIA